MIIPPVSLCHGLEPVGNRDGQHVRRITPSPVTACPAGGIHAPFVAQPERVLQGEDRGLSHGHKARRISSQFGSSPRAAKVSQHGGTFLLAQGSKPAERGVVVVGAGINHTVVPVIVRQVGIRGIICKGELQHLHPWIT